MKVTISRVECGWQIDYADVAEVDGIGSIPCLHTIYLPELPDNLNEFIEETFGRVEDFGSVYRDKNHS